MMSVMAPLQVEGVGQTGPNCLPRFQKRLLKKLRREENEKCAAMPFCQRDVSSTDILFLEEIEQNLVKKWELSYLIVI
jgi:hypothetical protein